MVDTFEMGLVRILVIAKQFICDVQVGVNTSGTLTIRIAANSIFNNRAESSCYWNTILNRCASTNDDQCSTLAVQIHIAPDCL